MKSENPDVPEVHFEQQYLDLMRLIWLEGDERRDRTGVGTRSIFGAQLRFDLSDGAMPLVTTKRVYWKTATRELLWFLTCLLYTSPSPRDRTRSRMPSSA